MRVVTSECRARNTCVAVLLALFPVPAAVAQVPMLTPTQLALLCTMKAQADSLDCSSNGKWYGEIACAIKLEIAVAECWNPG